MRAIVVGLALVGALLGCSNSNDLNAGVKLSLDEHQTRWEQRTFQSYEFDLVQSKLGATTDVHITVNGTTIVSIIDNTTGEPPEVDAGWPTIDELYSDAQSALGVHNLSVQVEFNEQYSYPSLVSINSNDPGGPYSAEVSNLAPTT
jgi:Family of unknown function (DUF6174)